MKLKRQFLISLLAICLAIPVSHSALARRPEKVANRLSAADGLPVGNLPKVRTSPAPQDQPSSPAQEQRTRFERITTADGLSFPEVHTVLQDHQGFMWFGTMYGLNRYDGHEFTIYTHNPGDLTSMRNNDVDTIFEDSDGTLWVGHGGGLDRFDRETESFAHVDTRGQVFSIYEDRAGTLWVGFWHGLYGYDRATDEMVHSRQPDPDAPDDWGARSQSESAVLAIYEDRRADLWIGTATGLARLDRDTGIFTRYRHDPGDPTSLSSDVVLAIYEDRQSTLWIGTTEGLDILDRSSETFTRFWRNPGDVMSILEDTAGTLWIGTIDGLAQLTPSASSERTQSQPRFSHFRHDPYDPLSLSDDIVLSLYEDHSGVLWIATANGMSKYIRRINQFTVYRESPVPSKDTQHPPGVFQSSGLSDGKVLTIYEDRDGTLWIGTSLGGLNRLDRQSGGFTVYQHDPADPTSLSSNTVRAVYQDQAGILWAGTGSGWLERFDTERGTFIHHRHLGDLDVTDIAEDPAGNLWIGTWGKGLYRLAPDRETLVHYEQHWREPDHWKRYGTLSSHITWAIYVDQAGVPWIGTYHGGINLWDSRPDRFAHYRHDPANQDSLSDDYVLSFWEDPPRGDSAGVMWIGTMGGLNRLDRDRQTFTRYTVADGLAHDIVGCILGDDAGLLWLSTPKGLSRFDPRTETFRNYDERDGVIAGMSYPEVCSRSRTGEMFFGGADGFYSFDPDEIEDNLYVPPVTIAAFKVSNETVDQYLPADEHMRLSHRENYLSFEFAALDYTIPERNEYAYMLEGLDEDWVYAGTRRHVDYPDLRAGEYVFRVKGSNSDGVWNEEGATVRITITPPPWETWWFRGIVLLVVAGSVIAGYWLRVRSIEARSRELESQVTERTSQLEALYRADEELYRHLQLDQVLQALVDAAVDLLQADKSALLVWDEEQRKWVVRVACGFTPTPMERQPLGTAKRITATAVAGGKPAIVQDTLTASRQEGEATRILQTANVEGIRSLMHLPIEVAGEFFGLFHVSFTDPHAFSKDEQRVFLALAQRASVAIENAQLYERAQELAALEERQRLARELHDAVTQTLFSASLIAEALPDLWKNDPDQGRQLLQKLRQLSQGALAEMRTLLMELRPAALAEASLKDLLQQLARAATGREGIPVTVEAEEHCELPTDVRIALYRIVQEALNNVVKHAEASQVDVDLRCLPPSPPAQAEGMPTRQRRRVELHISDDGRGFDPQAVSPERLGLGIMRERAAAIGAQLAVESRPGHGTRIRVLWEEEE